MIALQFINVPVLVGNSDSGNKYYVFLSNKLGEIHKLLFGDHWMVAFFWKMTYEGNTN
jgi:hypothetical protein